jgi:hypothetical protein
MTGDKFIGQISTEIKIWTKFMENNDGEHYFKFHLSEQAYNLVKEMLETGAPVHFAIQKERPKAAADCLENDPSENEVKE